jgi:hypothetical protein
VLVPVHLKVAHAASVIESYAVVNGRQSRSMNGGGAKGLSIVARPLAGLAGCFEGAESG